MSTPTIAVTVLNVLSSIYQQGASVGANVKGITSNAFHLINTPLNIEPDDLPGNTVVRIGVGLNNDILPNKHLTDSGGDAPVVIAFNENQEFIGHSKAGRDWQILSGGFMDFPIKHIPERKSQQPSHLQILAGDNGVCIAYISAIWPTGQTRIWLGDMGAACGYDWGYSNLDISDGMEYKPLCTWIDADHLTGVYASALQIDMNKFTAQDYNLDVIKDLSLEEYCTPPTMLFMDSYSYNFDHIREKDAEFWTAPIKPQKDVLLNLTAPLVSTAANLITDKPQHERQALALENQSPKQLVTSELKSHSAKAACSTPGYRGPDLVSVYEGLFCDEVTRTLWPICGTAQPNGTIATESCFDRAKTAIAQDGKHYLRTYVKSEVWV